MATKKPGRERDDDAGLAAGVHAGAGAGRRPRRSRPSCCGGWCRTPRRWWWQQQQPQPQQTLGPSVHRLGRPAGGSSHVRIPRSPTRAQIGNVVIHQQLLCMMLAKMICPTLAKKFKCFVCKSFSLLTLFCMRGALTQKSSVGTTPKVETAINMSA